MKLFYLMGLLLTALVLTALPVSPNIACGTGSNSSSIAQRPSPIVARG